MRWIREKYFCQLKVAHAGQVCEVTKEIAEELTDEKNILPTFSFLSEKYKIIFWLINLLQSLATNCLKSKYELPRTLFG